MPVAAIEARADALGQVSQGVVGAFVARFAPVAALIALAIAQQLRFGAFGDVSWMLTICEKWLGGGAPYVDFVETNPPAAIALYLPPTLVGHLQMGLY